MAKEGGSRKRVKDKYSCEVLGEVRGRREGGGGGASEEEGGKEWRKGKARKGRRAAPSYAAGLPLQQVYTARFCR